MVMADKVMNARVHDHDAFADSFALYLLHQLRLAFHASPMSHMLFLFSFFSS